MYFAQLTCEVGGATRAVEVHHVKRLKEGGRRFTGRNLRAVCSGSHQMLHRAR